MRVRGARIRRTWIGPVLTVLIGLSCLVSIDRLEAHSDRQREGQLLLAQVEIAASRQTLETLNILTIGQVSGKAGGRSVELALQGATEEIDEYGLYGLSRLERLTALSSDAGAATAVTTSFHRLQSEIAVALTELKEGDPNGAYIYGMRRIKPTFEVIEDNMAEVTLHFGAEADQAHLMAQIGGALTVVTAIGLLFVLRSRLDRERRRFEAELQHEALHDPLTDLPNRRLFQDRVETACRRKARGHGTALLLVDLDGFKQVNDSKGHEAGDRILAGVAERLQGCVRTSDTVARIGGDEFAILLDEVTQPVQVVGLADRIIESLALPFDLVTSTACVGASIGIAIHDIGESPAELSARADAAMYSAKRSGRGAYCVAAGTQTNDVAPVLGRVLIGA